ncbi:major facilitator superfamily domain-containing protein [Lasiosphaeris hirsuta]|uniref:Major facilitator superfamily domain-containing protein n=1 Tax=Lasiosphaeris hirsuta TaxID=260670 RepID=A0AA40DUG4_9PEZI|nr:major facilitator superfamily domain-containing protein [Lasiosphaeris hirsuta]
MLSVLQYRKIGKDVARHVSAGIEGGSIARGTVDSNNTNPQPRADDEEKIKQSQRGEEKKDGNSIWVRLDDEENDPLNPKNWSLRSRSKNIAVLSLLIFVQAWAGGAESMANAKASAEFGVSKVAENLSTAMYLFGIGSGALVAGPVSETVGRNPTYLVSTFFFLFFVLGSAMAPNFAAQVVCRYLVGLASSATLSINGGSVRDQFRPVKRSWVFPLIAWANVTAPVLAPIAGGWIASHPRLHWQWMDWITLVVAAAVWLLAVLCLPETYLPLLLDWKAKHLRRITGDGRYVSEHGSAGSFASRLKEKLPLPFIFFVTEPVVGVLGLYLVLLYVLLFSFLSGFDYIFKDTYGLPMGFVGSCFGAIATGTTVVTLCAPALFSWTRHKTEHIQGASVKPEFRLWPGIIAAPLLPIALFWLGWTNYSSISIWSGLAACFVFGMVLVSIYISSYEYIIDSYGDHAATALSSITFVRYIVAGGMVMAARPMYEGIGVHWTMTWLGCIASILAPAPLLFRLYGKKLREKSKYAE